MRLLPFLSFASSDSYDCPAATSHSGSYIWAEPYIKTRRADVLDMSSSGLPCDNEDAGYKGLFCDWVLVGYGLDRDPICMFNLIFLLILVFHPESNVYSLISYAVKIPFSP